MTTTSCGFCGHAALWHDDDQVLGTNPCSLCEECEDFDEPAER